MSKIKRWLDNRTQKLAKTEVGKTSVADFTTLLERELGPIAAQAFFDLAKNKTPFAIEQTLEKMGAARRLYGKFDPQKELSGDKGLANWTGGQAADYGSSPEARSKLPDPSPAAKLRMMNKIGNRTLSRLNTQTGQREFLMHRQMGQGEFDSFVHNGRINHTGDAHSSWTLHLPSIIESKGIYSRSDFDPEDNRSYNHVVSAWIPSSHIKTMPLQYGKTGTWDVDELGAPTKTALKEQEVIVRPGHNSEVHQILKDTGKSTKDWTWGKIYGKTNKSEDLLLFVEKYSSDPVFKEKVLAGLPSNFHRMNLEKSMVEYVDFLKTLLSDLTLRDLQKKSSDPTEVVAVMVCEGNFMLVGRRRKNGKWALPGGRVDKGETIEEAAVRELYEEAGLKIKESDLTLIGSRPAKEDSKIVHVFKVTNPGGEPHGDNDPDQEFEKWHWIRIEGKLPKKLLEDDMNTPTEAAFKEVGLAKAVKPKDWSRIGKAVNPEASLHVDEKPHLQQFPVHPEYSKMLNDPKKFSPHKLDENGISAKMVHEVPESGMFMSKPYHKKIESKTKDWVKNPILGWATMATKALFNAGKIGHLAEDVSAHEHEGVPLTVHKFAPGHKAISQVFGYRAQGGMGAKITGEINPLQVHQIGVMDYLTNNLDRHHGNLMINPETDTHGYNNLLAIDHERNFQYHKRLADSKWKNAWLGGEGNNRETPMTYVKGSALNLAQRGQHNWYSHEDLVDWWGQHGQDIKDELEKQVDQIKDESTRKHVRDNFNHRWHKMNDWANRLKDDPNSDEMYRRDSLDDAFDNTHNLKQEQPKISAKALKSLPKNKKDAFSSIADIINKKERLTHNQRSLLAGTISTLINQMSPEEAAETFKSVIDNPYMSTKKIKNEPELDVRNQMLRHFSQAQGWENGEPQFKYAHMKALADTIDNLPSEKKEILKHWAEHFRRLLSERAGRAA